MEVSNNTATHTTVAEEDNDLDYTYSDPDYDQKAAIGEEGHYNDPYNFYPDAGF